MRDQVVAVYRTLIFEFGDAFSTNELTQMLRRKDFFRLPTGATANDQSLREAIEIVGVASDGVDERDLAEVLKDYLRSRGVDRRSRKRANRAVSQKTDIAPKVFQGLFTKKISDFAFIPGTNRFVVCDQVGKCRVLDTETGQIPGLEWELGAEPLIAISPKTDLVAFAYGGEVSVKLLSSGSHLGHHHESQPKISGLSFSPDGSRLLSGGYGIQDAAFLYDWRKGEGKPLEQISGQLAHIAFSPNGKHIFYSKTGKVFRRCYPFDDTPEEELGYMGVHGTRFFFAADGSFVGLGSTNGLHLVRYHFATPTTPARKSVIQPPPIGTIWGLDVAPDLSLTANGDLDKKIFLREGIAGEVITSFGGHRAGISQVRFSPDAKLLLSGDESGEVRLWNLEKILED